MYAVVGAGGKQYRVTEGQVLKLEKVELAPGETLELDALMIHDGKKAHIGSPKLDGAKVVVEVVSHGRGDKIEILKFKRRKHHMKRMGHRQWYTEVKVTAIKAA